MHLYRRKQLDADNYIFIGCTKHSGLFQKAVDLQAREKFGLLFRTVRSARGLALTPDGKPKWSSSNRSCRVVWNLDIPEERSKANIAGEAIKRQTGFDLLNKL